MYSSGNIEKFKHLPYSELSIQDILLKMVKEGHDIILTKPILVSEYNTKNMDGVIIEKDGKPFIIRILKNHVLIIIISLK